MIHRSLVRRPVPNRPSAVLRLLAAAALAVLSLSGLGKSAFTQDAPEDPAAPRSRTGETPRFRAETNFVRVDVYATQNGAPVRDLRIEDVEVFEDGLPQKIETFEHVDVRSPQLRDEGREPQTVAEGRAMAEDPRTRIFVVFLDTYHTTIHGSHRMRRPLVDFLDRVIGPDDLFAVMTADMSARDLSLSRRTMTVEGMLSRHWTWGKRDAFADRDPQEKLYELCFPAHQGWTSCIDPADDTRTRTLGDTRSMAGVAGEMISRRREKRALDALADLATYLHGLREERKAVLVVTDGWVLYRPNPNLTRIGPCSAAPRPESVGVGPDGRLTTDVNRASGALPRTECERDRQYLANLDNWQTFHDLLRRANRSNVSFYPVDSRGLPASDMPIEHLSSHGDTEEDVSETRDIAGLRRRTGALRTMAEETDGMAVVDSNNIERGMRRIVDDLTSYYLLGYYSPNDKLDGKFRSIRVRIKRPGVAVRARRGYAPPTQNEIERGQQAIAAAIASAPPTAIQSALAALASGVRRDARLYTRVSWGSLPAGQSGRVWITAELDAATARAAEWASGGTADALIVADNSGETIGSVRAPLTAGSRVASLAVPPGPLQAGTYTLRLRVVPSGGGSPLTDTVTFAVPTEATGLGSPRLFRRGPTNASPRTLTANPLFRRTEHLRVAVPAAILVDGVEAELLDRTGKAIQVPVKTGTEIEDGITWVSAEIALAPLAPGDYVVRTSASYDNRRQEILTAFRVVP